MKLMDPTVPSAAANNVRAPRLANLQGATVGLLSNMKLNADVLLRETAELFVQHHDCQVAELVVKHNASAPAGDERIDRVVNQCDFMLTAMGD